MKIWVFSICWNEAEMLPWFLRHYGSFADKIIIWDEQSTDGSRELIKSCPKAELRNWPFKGLDDEKFLMAVNEWHKEAIGKADWIMWPDIDELLYHPSPRTALESPNGDVFQSTGYALISKNGLIDSGAQIYDQVFTGYRQENYDKRIIWRTHVEMRHTIGRHTYGRDWPKHKGNVASNVEFKLLHCHHVGGADFTSKRNKRNYARAVDKKYAWNYAPGEKSSGTEHWVEELIKNNKLIDVMTKPEPMLKMDSPKPEVTKPELKKLHFGCGGKMLEGWDNYDIEMDIRKPLPFGAGIAQYIFAEHVIEHVTPQQAWKFFEECKRVLATGGVLRVAIPDVYKIYHYSTKEYWEAVKAGGHGDGTRESSVKAAVFEHGHQGAWTDSLLMVVLQSIGFKVSSAEVGKSAYQALKEIEQHGKTVGESISRAETSVVEGVK